MIKTNDGAPVGCGIFVLIFYVALIYGYIANIYALTQLDFQAPYKAEIFRAVGVVSGIGAILGYVTFDEELKK
jgi:hypothetical protein